MKAISAIVLLSCSLITGCASPLRASVDAAKYETMSCVDLNVAMGSVASEISQTAIARGKVAHANIPTWLWGGQRVASAVAARESTKIERLRQQQAAIAAARSRKC
ncbi:conserved exported hypothetical protein [Mesorhizobium metallidurans STM 2683]|uniref:Lipoprotein n=1 Tax=Mesorhizobium metallidurans STM 2683 TaxID=1297569 RepID=M5F615_9HYPH|nr:hypothetical protein [Mesorhizobium metallidurans]CCV07331.1 conserved exported hypothetical protein [Mesorhizobium metallidurans STM 2683]